MDRLNLELAAQGKPSLNSLTGLNSGAAIAGNIGALRHKNYTVLGDTVNLASRLVAVNKIFRTAILVSETTQSLASAEIAFRTLDQVRVSGRQQSLKIYEVLGEKGQLSSQREQAVNFFERGLKHYWQLDFTGALARFEAALKLSPGDTPSLIFTERCRQYIAQPPDSTWTGVTSLDLRKTHAETRPQPPVWKTAAGA
jgi:adenylate cyclase